MNKVYFVFGIHNHQPVGNFEFVFEDAYQKSYLPFLEVLERHPRIRMAMHYSGILLDWLLEHHPDYVKRIRKLVATGQVEMITGAHYEPILMTIPDRDKIGQIQKLTASIRRHTGYRAKGLWLAERVWEPHLPKVLSDAGIEYTIVDDSHFKYAGLREEQLAGYYVTEEQGTTLNIFPISERLRYTIPFQHPDATLAYCRELAERGEGQIAIFADDGEKFGVWPNTFDHVYRDGWLEQFFVALENAGDWLEMIHFSEALDRIPPLGRVYLPTASYREMMEWALPYQATRELEDFENRLKESGLFERYSVYVRGGFWRNFLAKYPESNRMHKKMLYVSQKIYEARSNLSPKKQEQALDHLWAGQCNCPYWHGVFGGLYLTHLRHAIYKNLIAAENILSSALREKEGKVSVFDLSGNGKPDVIVESPIWNVYIDPNIGGNIFELDYRPAAVNLLDTMSRREEAYHRKVWELNQEQQQADNVASIHDLVMAKEDNLHQYLHYDWYDRNALIDHFLDDHTTLEEFATCKYREIGDFVKNPYRFRHYSRKGNTSVILEREGHIWQNGGMYNVLVRKKLRFSPRRPLIVVEYSLENCSDADLNCRFGVEWNVGLLAGNSHDRYYEIPGHELEQKNLASKGEIFNVDTIHLYDWWQKIRVSFKMKDKATFWRFPIETVSLSEAGFERVYQNSVVLLLWGLSLKPHQRKTLVFTYEVEKLG